MAAIGRMMTWSGQVEAWAEEGEAWAMISLAQPSPAGPQLGQEANGRLPLETHFDLRRGPLEIRFGQAGVAQVTKGILGRIDLVEYTKFVLGLAQFSDLLFAFYPYFLGCYSLLG